MSYLVLARKYRPQTFDEVYSQDHITEVLKNTIELDRTAHAYLFTGPRGVGKTSLARIFAKSLNCLNGGPTVTPCNTCQNCTEITQGISADVMEIDGASNTSVDDIRNLQKELLYSTTNSNFKIYIIDEVHMLSKNAFNALLKTLEEPPESVIFIFATTEPHKVLPTIVSRCQRFDFKRIPIPDIIDRLHSICQQEGIEAEEEALFTIAKKADGSMRDALSLMDQLLAYGHDKITLENVLSVFGIVHNDVYLEIMQALANKDASSILKQLHSILEKGNDIQEFINGLMDFIRNMLLLKMNLEVHEIPSSLLESLQKLNKKFSENELLYAISLLIKTKTDIKTSSNPILIAEMSFVKLAKLAQMTSIDKLLQQVSQNKNVDVSRLAQQPASQNVKKLHKQTQQIKKQIQEPEPVAKPNISKLTKEIYLENKPALVNKLRKEKMVVANYFSQAKLANIRRNTVSLIPQSRLGYDMLN
ncbi:MAG TPA: DNA polymerase III subunit gamma/tau, partial [Candidatus Cloacimonas sp.]|nr:DNA polymerase III subunit gamma/tau [Candidatus Cloacimonas sp.]